MSKHGSTRAWRRLRARVLLEEPVCRLQLPGCTRISTTGDHIIPVSVAPGLRYDRANVQGVCASCNYKRGRMPISMLDQIRYAPTQSDDAMNAKTVTAHGKPRALDFFGEPQADTSAVRLSIREGRNDSNSNCGVVQHDPPCLGA